MKLLVKNKKMVKTNKANDLTVFNWGIIAFKSKTGELTCRQAGNCAGPCYAQQKTYTFPVVKNALEERFALTKTNDFIGAMVTEIRKKRKIDYVRIHDSGDFYSEEYLNKWIKIMRDNPEVIFYAYTKEVEMFKKFEKHFPSNFHYVFSFGGKQDSMIDLENDRFAQVFESEEDIPSDYTNASNDDLLAIGLNKKIALVYHGYENRKNNKFIKTA